MPRAQATPPAVTKGSQVYLVHGEEELLVTGKAKDLIRRVIPADQELLGLEVIDAQSDLVAQALTVLKQCREAVLTAGFLGGRKAVWLRNANFLDQGVLGRSKDVRAGLRNLAELFRTGLPAGHILVITAASVDEKSPFYEACRAAGEVIGFKSEKAWQRDKAAVPFAADLFRKLGLGADGEVVKAFVDRAGTNFRQLQSEAEKLALYLGPGRAVQAADIETIVSPTRERFGWELEDALGDRDLSKALRILRRLLFQKEPPIKLFSGIESRFRSLLILREALDQGWIRVSGRFMARARMTPEQEQVFYEALNDNRLKNPYVAGQRARQAERFTRRELERCRRLVLNTRRRLVSSSVPAPLAMETMAAALCRRPPRKEKQ